MPDEFNMIKARVNPLDGAVFTACSDPELDMRPAEDCARFSLRISKNHLEKAVKAFGCDIPATIGEMSSSRQKRALCLGPDEWLILAPEDQQDTIAACFAEIREQIPHSLVNVGHRTTGIEIYGRAAALALNAGCPLNLDILPVGGCARTILDKAQIVLIRLDEEHFRLEILRSFAEFVWKFLSIAGRDINASSKYQSASEK